MSSSSEAVVTVPDVETLRLLLGQQDETRRLIERELPIKLIVRDDKIVVQGAPDAARRGAGLLEQLLGVARQSLSGGRPLAAADVRYLVQLAKSGEDVSKAESLLTDTLLVSERGKQIGPRTVGQKSYVEALRKGDLVFAIGPAGTGKTYLAVAAAVAALKSKSVSRIILTRPAVEAGEKPGLFAGRPRSQGRPVSAPAVRCAL
jgi:phosphate starvation-inducible PhoH-like protein